MIMPEVSFSMANLRFALDIKPADISPAPSPPQRPSSAGDGSTEDFGSTLARASEPAGRNSAEFSSKPGNVGRRDDSQKSSPESKPRKSSDSPAGGAAVISQKAPATPDKGGNEGSKAATSSGESQTVTDTASTGSIVQNGNSVSSALTMDAALAQTVVSTTVTGSYATGVLIDTLADLLGPEVETAATVDSPADSVAPDNTPRPDFQFAVSADRRLVLDVPVLNTSEEPGDVPVLQTATRTPTNGAAEQATSPEQYDLVASARPRGEFAQARSSEWTQILEFSRLLNPRVEREAVLTNQRPSEQPIQNQAWRPDTRPTPEGSRDSWQPRFSEPVGDSARPAGDSKIWTVDPATAVAGNRVASEQLVFARSQFRMPMEVSQLTSQAVVAADSTGAIVGSRPVVSAQGTSALIEIQPEILVSDVREAVMRIAADGRGEARITLHPPELGELVVRIESARNGVVRAEFHTMSPLVREALETGLTRLIQALESEGLTLEQANVYLSFNLGAEGNAGESEPGSANGNTALGSAEEISVSDATDESAMTVESLPEGATISILA